MMSRQAAWVSGVVAGRRLLTPSPEMAPLASVRPEQVAVSSFLSLLLADRGPLNHRGERRFCHPKSGHGLGGFGVDA